MSYQASNRASILARAKQLEGKALAESIPGLEGPISGPHAKGWVGHAYERYFGIPPNSLAKPDFQLAGIELKIVPLRRLGTRLSIKERTFITAINYGKIEELPWNRSHLFEKSREILFIFYEWIADTPMHLFRTLKAQLWTPSELDDMLLRSCYDRTRTLVIAGRAQEISEADTEGVGASTKGQGGQFVKQPRSTVAARPRAFAFKAAFVQQVWDRINTREPQRLIEVPAEDYVSWFEESVRNKFSAYLGQTGGDIAADVAEKMSWRPKDALATLSRRILGVHGRRLPEFEKMGVTMKTVRVGADNRPLEAVSFRAFDPFDFDDEDWDSSPFHDAIRHMFFVVYRSERRAPQVTARLHDTFFWIPSADDEGILRREWEMFRGLLMKGRMDELPTAKQTMAIHVRPHGEDSTDQVELPGGGTWTKSSLWLNQDFVQRIISDHFEAKARR